MARGRSPVAATQRECGEHPPCRRIGWVFLDPLCEQLRRGIDVSILRIASCERSHEPRIVRMLVAQLDKRRDGFVGTLCHPKCVGEPQARVRVVGFTFETRLPLCYGTVKLLLSFAGEGKQVAEACRVFGTFESLAAFGLCKRPLPRAQIDLRECEAGWQVPGIDRMTMPNTLKWTDAEDLAIRLHERFPELDPLTVRFTDLHRWVCELDEFGDDQWWTPDSGIDDEHDELLTDTTNGALAADASRIWVGQADGLVLLGKLGGEYSVIDHLGKANYGVPGLIHSDVNDLAWESYGSVWAATEGGLSHVSFDPEEGWSVESWTTEAGREEAGVEIFGHEVLAPLPDAPLWRVALHPEGDRVYVASRWEGLAELRLAEDPDPVAEALDAAYLYPNPARGDMGHQAIWCGGIDFAIDVSIYNLEGQLVHERRDLPPGEPLWPDLGTRFGNRAASGAGPRPAAFPSPGEKRKDPRWAVAPVSSWPWPPGRSQPPRRLPQSRQ